MKLKITMMALLSCFMFTTSFAQQTEVTGTLSAGSGYVAGETIEIPFNLDFTNIDEEYADFLELTFPAGVTIEGVSNDVVFIDNSILFGAGAPNADFNGIVGQTVSWGDDNNSFGGIFTSATIGGVLTALSYDFTVTVTVDAGITGDLSIDFFASGDEFGPNPADLTGTVTIGEGVSVYGIVVNSDVHNTLEVAINAAGLAGALATLDPATLFAPTDAAFDELEAANPGIIAGLLADPAALGDILLYHVANVEAFAGDLNDNQEVTTLQGNPVTVTIEGTDVFVNGELVVVADLDASNGVVHAIDGVLLPPPSIALPLDFELGAENYTIEGFGGAQNTAVIPNPDASGINTSANVWQQTQDAANTGETFAGAVLTLDVPVDFSGSSLVAMDIWTPLEVTAVTLRFEVANNDPASAGLELTLPATTTNAWETLVFDFTGEPNLANEMVRCVVFFNLGNNNTDDTFYIDNIRGTALPTVFDIVANSDVHNTLETALIESGLDAVTNDAAADLTLFAPTDAAFDALPEGVLASLLEDPTGALANVLLYHVVGGTALSTDLSDGQEVLTLQGETVTVAINGDVITINGAEVVIADIEAVNGVVHVIDAVLVPSTCTVVAGGPYTNFTTTFGGAPVAVDGVCPVNVIEAFESWASEAYVAAGCVEGTTYTFGLQDGASGAWDPAFLIVDATTGEVIASETEGLSITWECPADGDYIWIIQEEGLCGNQSTNTTADNGFPYMTCGDPLSSTDFVLSNDLRVFPNPTNSQFTVDIELNAAENVTIDVINVMGQVVKSVDLGTRSAGLNREYIVVNDLSEGIYFMNLTVGATQGTVKVQVVR
jgi:uncharacterized surface protein with fasciclin (FAS1) repeats